MNKIGIMQGRVLPQRLDHLQIFPISNWQEEICRVDELGFDCIELLFDKELILSKLLNDVDNLKSLKIELDSTINNFAAESICVDYLSSIPVLNSETEHLFHQEIVKLIDNVKGTTIDVLIIPFCDANFVRTKKDLQLVLEWIEEKKKDEIASESNIILALELSLTAIQIQSAFNRHSFKNIAICFDLGNARGAGYCPEEEISVLNTLIAHVHIKDKKVNGPNVMLGEGDVNFSACFKSLKEIGYEGQFILETAYVISPVTEAKKNLQFINNIVAQTFS